MLKFITSLRSPQETSSKEIWRLQLPLLMGAASLRRGTIASAISHHFHGCTALLRFVK